MARERDHQGFPERIHIDVNNGRELEHWSERLGATPDEVREAVERVGAMSDDVELELNSIRQRKPRTRSRPKDETA